MILSENILKCMTPDERRKLGKAGMTAEERNAKAERRAERDIQADIANLLRLRGIEFYQARMDRKTGGTLGWPDFTFCLPVPGSEHGLPVALEVKTGTGTLSPAQKALHPKMQANGWEVRVVRGVREAIDALDDMESRAKAMPRPAKRVSRRVSK